jgi:hypothetical protein
MTTFIEEMVATLRAAKKAGRLVAVHKWDDEPDIFVVGYVSEIEDDAAEFWWVDSKGRDDDDVISRVAFDKIVRLSVDTFYLRKLERLHLNIEAVYSKVTRARQTKLQKGILGALAAAAQTGEAVELGVVGENRPVEAFVVEAQASHARLRPVSDEFGIDGVWVIRMDQIQSVRRGSEGLAATLFLFGK